MEFPQYEGLPPFSDFVHNGGKSGHASILTYDASREPMTASSIIIRLNEQTRAPKGLCKSLSLRDGLVDKAILNANGDCFFRTDKTAARLSQEYDILGVDITQSNLGACDYDNPIRFDVFETFEDFNQARLVFYAHSSYIARLVSNELFANFHCFQPFVRRLSESLVVFAYLPLGKNEHAFVVVTEEDTGHSKLLQMNLGLGSSSHLNHWAFFIETKEECDEDGNNTLVEAHFYLTNLCKPNDGSLQFFYSEEVFCLPRHVYSVCAECLGETSMSQLCGGHFCHTAESFENLNPAVYKIAIERVKRKNQLSNELKTDYHFLGSLKISTTELFEQAPKTISSSTISVFRETYTIRVNGHLFDARVDFGRVVDVFESTIPEPEEAIAFSPLFGKTGNFFYVKKDGLLVLQDDIFGEGERKVYGRLVPKEAENVKLFLPLRNTVYCYWTIGRKHYMTNLETFLVNGILGATEHRE